MVKNLQDILIIRMHNLVSKRIYSKFQSSDSTLFASDSILSFFEPHLFTSEHMSLNWTLDPWGVQTLSDSSKLLNAIPGSARCKLHVRPVHVQPLWPPSDQVRCFVNIPSRLTPIGAFCGNRKHLSILSGRRCCFHSAATHQSQRSEARFDAG